MHRPRASQVSGFVKRFFTPARFLGQHHDFSGERINKLQGAMLVLFGFSVLFSVTDFFTSSSAVSIGLLESNPLLNGVSAWTRTSLPVVFAESKLAVMGAGLTASLIGVRSQDRRVELISLVVLGLFVGLYLFATVNNLYWIDAVR